MRTSTVFPRRRLDARQTPPLLRQRGAMPRTFVAVCRAMGWSEKLAVCLWGVALANDADPHAKAILLNYRLLDDRIQGLPQDRLVAFLQQNASPRSLVRLLELGVQSGHVRRAVASKMENRLFAQVDSQGNWRS
ncbi:MAG: hypothetical protein AB7N91_32135 [Candidatus Tectimicrobiota bacterium]